MKASLAAFGLFAPLTSFVAASPAANALTQLEGRDPIVCIGCVTSGNCVEKSEPDGCENVDNGSGCTIKFCQAVAIGCRCCSYNEDGSVNECSEV